MNMPCASYRSCPVLTPAARCSATVLIAASTADWRRDNSIVRFAAESDGATVTCTKRLMRRNFLQLYPVMSGRKLFSIMVPLVASVQRDAAARASHVLVVSHVHQNLAEQYWPAPLRDRRLSGHAHGHRPRAVSCRHQFTGRAVVTGVQVEPEGLVEKVLELKEGPALVRAGRKQPRVAHTHVLLFNARKVLARGGAGLRLPVPLAVGPQTNSKVDPGLVLLLGAVAHSETLGLPLVAHEGDLVLVEGGLGEHAEVQHRAAAVTKLNDHKRIVQDVAASDGALLLLLLLLSVVVVLRARVRNHIQI
mmetsp:Transcript_44145/g.88541  ORF Transcript_44145/g.88541 Transcript_44145/m.88541 type:complete len:306 (-) Transcript_44145:865-1782(-)